MDKLEQVSENPELKQEMEAEVASTNSNQVTLFTEKFTLILGVQNTYRERFYHVFYQLMNIGNIRS